MMDASLMPCKGQYCETTCQQWYRSILAPAGSVTVSCKEFSDFAFYPKGALIALMLGRIFHSSAKSTNSEVVASPICTEFFVLQVSEMKCENMGVVATWFFVHLFAVQVLRFARRNACFPKSARRAQSKSIVKKCLYTL